MSRVLTFGVRVEVPKELVEALDYVGVEQIILSYITRALIRYEATRIKLNSLNDRTFSAADSPFHNCTPPEFKIALISPNSRDLREVVINAVMDGSKEKFKPME